MNGLLATMRSQPYLTMAATACIVSLATQYFNYAQAGYGWKMALKMTALFFASILLGIVCAIAGYWLNRGVFSLPIGEWFQHIGLVLLYGAIVAVVFFAWVCRLMRLDVGRMLSVSAASLAVFFGIWRIGCAFAGCCYGRPMDFTLLGYHFTRFPTQITESLFFLLLFLLFQLLIKKRRVEFLILSYSVFRFFLEFLRGDDRGVLIPGSPLSPTQIIILPLVAVTLGVMLYRRLKSKRSGQASAPMAEEPTLKERARI